MLCQAEGGGDADGWHQLGATKAQRGVGGVTCRGQTRCEPHSVHLNLMNTFLRRVEALKVKFLAEVRGKGGWIIRFTVTRMLAAPT